MSSEQMNDILFLNDLSVENTKDLISGFLKKNMKGSAYQNLEITKAIVLFYFCQFYLTPYFNIDDKIQYIPNINKTWILCANSEKCISHAHSKYISHNILEIFDNCSCGDKIKLYGIHDMHSYIPYNMDYCKLNVHIIGINNAILKNFNPEIFESNIIIENLTIICGSAGELNAAINCDENSSLYLINCNIEFSDTAISTCGNLFIKNCIFSGCRTKLASAICISPWSEKIIIMHSTFKNDSINPLSNLCLTNYSCIQIYNFEYQFFRYMQSYPTTKLYLFRNTFIGNHGYLVSKKKVIEGNVINQMMNDWYHQFEENRNYILRNNIIKVNNIDKCVNNGNILGNQILDYTARCGRM